MTRGWIGVDLDGTLARHDGNQSKRIGEPIPAMVERVKMWLREGREVRLVTARAARSSFHIFPYRTEPRKLRLSSGVWNILGTFYKSKRIRIIS